MRLWGIVALAAIGCGGNSGGAMGPTYIDGFTPPAANANEMTVVSPVIKAIAPGTDVTLCSYLDTTFADATDIINFRAYQSVPGHHVMLTAVRRSQDPNTHECTEDDMVNILTFVAGGGAEGTTHFQGVPAGLGFRIPAGTQLMLQSHWINATTQPHDGQAVIYLQAQPTSDAITPTDQFLADTEEFMIPAGQTMQATTTCPFQEDVSFWLVGGHMHEWGKHIRIELLDANAAAHTIYEQDWQPAYMTDPPDNFYTKDQPFVIKAGQSVRVTCQWDNTMGAADLRFPTEMCYFVGYYFPGHGMRDCADGVWPQ